MDTSLFLSLSCSPTLSVSVSHRLPLLSRCVGLIGFREGRISLLCLSMIRSAASLMQSYYLHSSADGHRQGEAAVTCHSVRSAAPVRFQAPYKSRLHL